MEFERVKESIVSSTSEEELLNANKLFLKFIFKEHTEQELHMLWELYVIKKKELNLDCSGWKFRTTPPVLF